MAFSIGSFFATLGMEDSDYTRGILGAQALNQVFGQSFANFVASPVLGGIDLFKKFAAGVDALAGRAEGLTLLAARTGLAVETLQAFDLALRDAGADAGAGAQALEFFTNRLGEVRVNGDAAAQVFSRIGVDLTQFGSTEDALRRALDAIAALPDQASRAAAAQDLFGRANGSLAAIAVGTSSNLADLREEFERMGLIRTEDQVSQLNDLAGAIDRFKFSAEGASSSSFATVVTESSDEVGKLLEKVSELASRTGSELNPVMRDAGDGIGAVAEMVRLLIEYLDKLTDKIPSVTGAYERYISQPVANEIVDVVYGGAELNARFADPAEANRRDVARAQRRRARSG